MVGVLRPPGGDMSDRRLHIEDDAERATWAPHVKIVRCVECRRAWLVSTERWRFYLIETTDEMPSLALSFCPACALRLFGEV
jgi:hypothetical protein